MRTPVKFYADEHIADAVVRGLRQRGIDVQTVRDVPLLGASDKVQLERARSDGRVMLTQDDDFLRLHAAGLAHAGIVYAPQGTTVGGLIRGLLLIHDVLTAEEMTDHVEFV